LNPNWNDPAPSDPVEAQAAEDEKFLIASGRMGEEFSRDLDYYAKSWLPARDIVYKAYAKRLEYDSKGRILVFDGQSVPWKDHLYTLEGQRLMRNGEYSVYQSPRTLSKAESHCLKHGEDSETRSWMRSLESAAVSSYMLQDSSVATSLSREPRLWLSRRLIFEYGFGMHCRALVEGKSLQATHMCYDE